MCMKNDFDQNDLDQNDTIKRGVLENGIKKEGTILTDNPPYLLKIFQIITKVTYFFR